MDQPSVAELNLQHFAALEGYRIERDPHMPTVWWRVRGDCMQYYEVGSMWLTHAPTISGGGYELDRALRETPERLAVWTYLKLLG